MKIQVTNNTITLKCYEKRGKEMSSYLKRCLSAIIITILLCSGYNFTVFASEVDELKPENIVFEILNEEMIPLDPSEILSLNDEATTEDTQTQFEGNILVLENEIPISDTGEDLVSSVDEADSSILGTDNSDEAATIADDEFPDLVFRSFEPTEGTVEDGTPNNPFPLGQDITFDIVIANAGKADATNIPVGTYINGDLWQSKILPVTLKPNYMLRFQIKLRNETFPGMYKFKVIANMDKRITELDYENNFIQREYQWGSGTPPTGTGGELRAVDLYTHDGVTTFESARHKIFQFKVANTGPALPLVKVQIYLNGQVIPGCNYVIENFRTNSYHVQNIDLLFPKKGQFTIGMYVDPSHELPSEGSNDINDPKRKNNKSSRQFDVTFDYNILSKNGRYPDNTSLSMAIFDNTNTPAQSLSILTNNGFTIDDLLISAQKWHSYIPNITFDSINVVNIESDLDNYDVKIHIEANRSDNSFVMADALSQGTPYNKTNVGIYSNAFNEYLKNTYFDKVASTNQYKTADILNRKIGCMTHEFGHALGLNHVLKDCKDMSLLTDTVTAPNAAPTIQPHEQYTIAKRYP